MRRSDLAEIARWVHLSLVTAGLTILALAVTLILILAPPPLPRADVADPYMLIPPGITTLPAVDAAQQSPGFPLTTGTDPTKGSSFYLPDASSRPHNPIQITRIYLPFSLEVGATVADTPPESVVLQLMLLEANRLFWVYSTELPMIKDPALPNISSVSSSIVADLVNPIGVDETENPAFWATVMFDQGAGGGYIGLAMQISDPDVTTPLFVPSFGTAYYTIPTD